jgi:uncharacterized protein (DUF305 family)
MHIRYRAPLCTSFLLVAAAAFPVAAQQAQHEQSGEHQQGQTQHGGGMMGMHGPAMQAAMERMQQGMSAPMSGDPDIDFARMMIPHHQSAIDMARSELEHGKDEELRRMAQKIIDDQGREIAELNDWLARHPAK